VISAKGHRWMTLVRQWAWCAVVVWDRERSIGWIGGIRFRDGIDDRYGGSRGEGEIDGDAQGWVSTAARICS